MFSKEKHLPHWLILLIDLFLCVLSIYASYLLRFKLNIPSQHIERLVIVIPLVIAIRGFSFFAFNTYLSIIRQFKIFDAAKIILAAAISSLLISLINFIHHYLLQHLFIPISIVIIDFSITCLLIISFRIIVKTIYHEFISTKIETRGIILFGAGKLGSVTKKMLDKESINTNFSIVGFADDNPFITGKKIDGIYVYNARKELDYLINKHQVEFLIIAILNVSAKRKKEIIEYCLNRNVKVLSVPPLTTWLNSELNFNQLKKAAIKDLLASEVVQMDHAKIKQQLTGKTILITGAAGSLGSQLVSEIFSFYPNKIILFDQAEPLNNLSVLSSKEEFKAANYEMVLGNIRDKDRLKYVFETYKPHIIYHVATYNNVSLIENNPTEAVLTNIFGTRNVADLAANYNAEKVVFVSTYKALNPSSILGASKRIAEAYLQSLNTMFPTKFVSVRIGNITEANSFIVQQLRKQIESGSFVTVCHPEATVNFTTAQEASQFVLEAGTISNGGEIFLFNIEDSIKIVELAKMLIKLSGLTLGKDLQLTFTGLKQGEKIHEETFADNENTKPTHHPKIMVAKSREYNFNTLSSKIDELLQITKSNDNMAIVKKMKEIVPEYISQNSIYEVLDKIGSEATREPKIIKLAKAE